MAYPAIYKSAEPLQADCDKYIAIATANGMEAVTTLREGNSNHYDEMPSVEALICELGMSATSFYSVYPKKGEDFAKVLTHARTRVQRLQAEWVARDPRGRARWGEFLLKSHDRKQYGDKQTIEQVGSGGMLIVSGLPSNVLQVGQGHCATPIDVHVTEPEN